VQYLITIFLIITTFTALASDKDEMDKLASPIFQSISSGEHNKITSTALSNSSISKYIAPADLANSDSQFAGLLNGMGKYFSHELLHEQGIKGTFWLRWYLVKYERQPALFRVEFYKSNDKWEVHTLGIDTDLDEYIKQVAAKEIGKLGLLKEN